MRELNECKAEVFRRSEKRINKRRKTSNRVLALCVPLCLMVTVWSVMILPTMLPAEKSYITQDGMTKIDDSNGQSLVHSYVQVEIQNAGSSPEYYRKVTDAPGVMEVFCLIHDLTFVDGVQINEVAPGDSDELNGAEDIHKNTDDNQYIITFTTVDGAERVYVLNDSELLDEGTGMRICLSDEQLAELKAVLSLPQ